MDKQIFDKCRVAAHEILQNIKENFNLECYKKDWKIWKHYVFKLRYIYKLHLINLPNISRTILT